jgi:hypothetical protein
VSTEPALEPAPDPRRSFALMVFTLVGAQNCFHYLFLDIAFRLNDREVLVSPAILRKANEGLLAWLLHDRKPDQLNLPFGSSRRTSACALVGPGWPVGLITTSILVKLIALLPNRTFGAELLCDSIMLLINYEGGTVTESERFSEGMGLSSWKMEAWLRKLLKEENPSCP